MSVRQVIDAVGRATGRPVVYSVGPRRAGDPARLVAGSGKAQRELGLKPAYARLDDIVRTAVQWDESHPQGYATTASGAR